MANPYGKYRLHLKNFRAIEEADITLDGITVVAGINACGKSTISRLFYKTFWSAINFKRLVYREVFNKYESVLKDLENLSLEINRGANVIDFFPIENAAWEKDKDWAYEELGLGQLQGMLPRLRRQIASLLNLPETIKNKTSRWIHFWEIDKLISEQNNSIVDKEQLLRALADLEARVKNDIVIARERLIARDIRIFNAEISRDFEELYDEEGIVFSFFDDDGIVTDEKNWYFAPISGVKRVFYYDTPHLNLQLPAYNKRIGFSDSVCKALKEDKPENWNANESIAALNTIFQRLVKGKISAQLVLTDYEDATYETIFEYLRNDGLKIDFHQCSSGFKVLGLLQMLMNKGALTETTAVFLDEPEAYLHPEWIVEYARMLVLINKTLGTRFFIATHNPDMTSAIRYISEKEGTLDSVNFYIAEESPTSKYQYRYREAREEDDEKSIGPLFESFVRGIEKIAEYSNPCGEQEDTSDE